MKKAEPMMVFHTVRARRFNPAVLVIILPVLSALLCAYGAVENMAEGNWLLVAILATCVSVNMVCTALILKYARGREGS